MTSRPEYQKNIAQITCTFLNKELEQKHFIASLLENCEQGPLNALYVGILVGAQLYNFDPLIYRQMCEKLWNLAND